MIEKSINVSDENYFDNLIIHLSRHLFTPQTFPHTMTGMDYPGLRSRLTKLLPLQTMTMIGQILTQTIVHLKRYQSQKCPI